MFFAFNGTAANSLALASLCQSYHSVICSETAHVETDECGAPEFFSNGSKLLLAKTDNGKLTPQAIREIARKRQDIHYPKPRVVTLTQATEVGTVYRPEEVRAISQVCEELGLHLHMDGARFSNACAFLGCTPAELTWKAGVDVLCFGGTKNGMAVGEAIVFFNKDLAEDFDYRCKQAGQLASKMRYLSAPWVGILQNDVWLKYANHANRCAQLLANLVADVPGVSLMFRVEANGVFLQLSEPAIAALTARGWRFYTFIGAGGALEVIGNLGVRHPLLAPAHLPFAGQLRPDFGTLKGSGFGGDHGHRCDARHKEQLQGHHGNDHQAQPAQ